MTLLELVTELNEVVANDIILAQSEIDENHSAIKFADGSEITWDDWGGYSEDDLEMGFDPYEGCYTYDC